MNQEEYKTELENLRDSIKELKEEQERKRDFYKQAYEKISDPSSPRYALDLGAYDAYYGIVERLEELLK